VNDNVRTVRGHDIRCAIAALCPNYVVSEDTDGELVIHTGMRELGDDVFTDME
jgi:hypothetical protein